MRKWLVITIIAVSVVTIGLTWWICISSKRHDKFDKRFPVTDDWIDKYIGLPQACSRRTVVTMTAMENEIDMVRKTILSLVNQSCRVSQFALTILINQEVVLPPDLNKMVNVFKAGKNYGSLGNAIIPTLLRENEANTIMIIVKPGDIFKRNFVSKITNLFLDNPTGGPVDLNDAILITTEMMSAEILTSVLESRIDLDDYIQAYKSTTDVVT